MIAVIFSLLTSAGQGVPVPAQYGQEWFYPADAHVIYTEKLIEANVVAIVRPVGRSFGERRPMKDLQTGEQPGDTYVATDAFRVVDIPLGGLGDTVRSLFVHGYRILGASDLRDRPDPDPSSNYLLIAKKPVENRAVFPELSRKFGETARQWSVPVRNPDEVAGYVLLRTGKSRVHASEDRKEMILLSVAEALDGASDKSARHIT
ncbi:MAG: hypothetical protein IH851_08065, partial [Armatimonadetes bacterium]|nr:hypothetical protein [Armatimonadota bacterium]